MSVHKVDTVDNKTVYIDLPTPTTPESLSELIIAVQQISLLKYDRFDGAIIDFVTCGYIDVSETGYIVLKENKLDGYIDKELELDISFNYVDEKTSLKDLLLQTFNNHWDEISKIVPHIKERIQFEYS
jgi:hypothetical protein